MTKEEGRNGRKEQRRKERRGVIIRKEGRKAGKERARLNKRIGKKGGREKK